MVIDISSIIKTDGATLNVRFEGMPENLNSEASDVKFKEPVIFNGSLVNTSGILKLDGILKADYSFECSNCLKESERSIELHLKEDFIQTADEDDEAYTYDGNVIKLDKVLEDSLILNLPLRQLCSDSCKGLCPKCGVDLNLNKCNCREENIDARLETLNKFYDK